MSDADRVRDLLATLDELAQHERGRRQRLFAAVMAATEALGAIAHASSIEEAQGRALVALHDVAGLVREP